MVNPKGLLQVLRKRVFMDTFKDVCNYYTLRGREDYYGNTIIEMSLREIMLNCLNFIKKETLLQSNDCKMGEFRDHIFVDRATKCHLYLSGEGVEYSWVCANKYYRKL